MNPLVWAKIGLVGAFLVGVFISGHHIGEKAVQARWDADKAMRIEAQDKLIAEHAKDMEALQAKHDAINVKVGTDHDAALQAIQIKYNADLAAVRAAGGLRIPRSACGGSVATTSKTASDSGHHEDTAGTVALPDSITNDLFNLARSADEVTEQARACQSWISANGFYGALPVQ